MAGTPAAEVEVDAGLAQALLREQHPILAHLPCVPVEAGWDNVMVRLGDTFCLRLPRRAAAASLIEHEQAWLPGLADKLPLLIPAPLWTGEPGCGYPWRWSIVPWLAGGPADLQPPHSSEAPKLGAFLRALHQPAPTDAPLNPFRGVPLQKRAPAVEERMRRLESQSSLITREMWRMWAAALAAPVDVGPTWIHGDLHPRNVLVEDGVFSGIIDWGDIAAGDRATDLAAIWMLFDDPQARRQAWQAYGSVTYATYMRAKGWAIGFGVTLLEAGLADDPRHAAVGEQTLSRVAAGS
jgi:aminoglycoside phosphotransferase (APT) family kinase protein